MAADSSADFGALLCQVDSRICALSIEHVVETMRALPLEVFPGMPSFVSGLSIIRGVPVPVVDLGGLFGGAPATRRDQLVTLRLQDRRVALAVDSVLGIRALERGSLTTLPPLLRAANAEIVSALGRVDSGLLLLIESARLVPDSVWALLGAHGKAS